MAASLFRRVSGMISDTILPRRVRVSPRSTQKHLRQRMRSIASESKASSVSPVNLEKYPINDTGSERYRELVLSARRSMETEGCCILDEFITDEGVEAIQKETLELVEGNRALNNQNGNQVNCYYSAGNASLGSDHPKNVMFSRSFGVVRDDMIPGNATLRAVY
jgi:hypothetical protein